MLQRLWLADLDPDRLAARDAARTGDEDAGLMHVGLVCPYAWDTPGGVAVHINDLRNALIRLGHTAAVLAPAEDEATLPDFVTSGGKPIAIQLQRLGGQGQLRPGRRRAGRAAGSRRADFDILHVHEPAGPDAGDPVDLGGRRPDRGDLARQPGVLAPRT